MNVVSTSKSFEISGVSEMAIRMRLFPLPLYGEEIIWLNEFPHDSITSWRELKEAFLRGSSRDQRSFN